jgi:HAD superfamily hydrolase (TIGR01509 family)
MTDQQLKSVLAATGPVLLDFDGPVCGLYAGDVNARASRRLRDRLRDAGVDVPNSLENERDPLAVLRFVGSLGRLDLAASTDQALTAIEIDAVPSAPITEGSEDFLLSCAESGRPVVIVSNNAPEAIDTYLGLHGLSGLVMATIGRSHGRPQLMKPHPWAVNAAVALLARQPEECLLVGDSVTDIEVSRKVGLRSVAYVKAPDRRERLAAARPDALIDSMGALAGSVRSVALS